MFYAKKIGSDYLTVPPISFAYSQCLVADDWTSPITWIIVGFHLRFRMQFLCSVLPTPYYHLSLVVNHILCNTFWGIEVVSQWLKAILSICWRRNCRELKQIPQAIYLTWIGREKLNDKLRQLFVLQIANFSSIVKQLTSGVSWLLNHNLFLYHICSTPFTMKLCIGTFAA